jgi:hypothetical protein
MSLPTAERSGWLRGFGSRIKEDHEVTSAFLEEDGVFMSNVSQCSSCLAEIKFFDGKDLSKRGDVMESSFIDGDASQRACVVVRL